MMNRRRKHSLMTNKLLMTELLSNSGETLWMRCSLGVGLGLQQNRWLMLKRLGVRSSEAVAVQELQCGKKKHRRERNDCFSHPKRLVSLDMDLILCDMCFYSICIRYHNDFCANAISDVLFKGLPTKYMHCIQPRVICDLRPITCILLVPNIKME